MTDPTQKGPLDKRPVSTSMSYYDLRRVEIAGALTGKNVSEFTRVATVNEADKILNKFSRSNSTALEKSQLEKATKFVDAPKPEKESK